MSSLSRLHYQMHDAIKSIIPEAQGISHETIDQYKEVSKRIVRNYFDIKGVKDIRDVPAFLQDMIDTFVAEGKSPYTIRAYFSAVAKALNTSRLFTETITASNYNFPIRQGGVGVKKGRMENMSDKNLLPCQTRDASPRVWDFCEKMGFRKGELIRLKGASLKHDESGYLCIQVRGKGGKLHKQRIEKEYIPFVLEFFKDLIGDAKVFTKTELKACSNQNLHYLRRLLSQKVYFRVIEEIGQSPEKAKRYFNEMELRVKTAEQRRAQIERKGRKKF